MSDGIEQLWTRVLEGNASAWRKLVETWSPLVMAVARRNGLGQVDAEDCVQYTWFSLYRRRENLKQPAALPGWLIRVASRRAKRMLNSDELERRRRLNYQPAAEPVAPDTNVEALEQAALVRLAIEELPPRCRGLLEALFFSEDEVSYPRIAKSLGIPLNSLGPTRSRCLSKLKKILKGYGL